MTSSVCTDWDWADNSGPDTDGEGAPAPRKLSRLFSRSLRADPEDPVACADGPGRLLPDVTAKPLPYAKKTSAKERDGSFDGTIRNAITNPPAGVGEGSGLSPGAAHPPPPSEHSFAGPVAGAAGKRSLDRPPAMDAPSSKRTAASTKAPLPKDGGQPDTPAQSPKVKEVAHGYLFSLPMAPAAADTPLFPRDAPPGGRPEEALPQAAGFAETLKSCETQQLLSRFHGGGKTVKMSRSRMIALGHFDGTTNARPQSATVARRPAARAALKARPATAGRARDATTPTRRPAPVKRRAQPVPAPSGDVAPERAPAPEAPPATTASGVRGSVTRIPAVVAMPSVARAAGDLPVGCGDISDTLDPAAQPSAGSSPASGLNQPPPSDHSPHATPDDAAEQDPTLDPDPPRVPSPWSPRSDPEPRDDMSPTFPQRVPSVDTRDRHGAALAPSTLPGPFPSTSPTIKYASKRPAALAPALFKPAELPGAGASARATPPISESRASGRASLEGAPPSGAVGEGTVPNAPLPSAPSPADGRRAAPVYSAGRATRAAPPPPTGHQRPSALGLGGDASPKAARAPLSAPWARTTAGDGMTDAPAPGDGHGTGTAEGTAFRTANSAASSPMSSRTSDHLGPGHREPTVAVSNATSDSSELGVPLQIWRRSISRTPSLAPPAGADREEAGAMAPGEGVGGGLDDGAAVGGRRGSEYGGSILEPGHSGAGAPEAPICGAKKGARKGPGRSPTKRRGSRHRHKRSTGSPGLDPAALKPLAHSRRGSADAHGISTAPRRPSAGSRRPSADSRRPSADSRRPSADSRRPSAGSRRPSADSRRPSADSRRPSADSRRPSADSRRPSADSRRPSADSRRPSADSRRPSAGSSGSSTGSRRSSTGSRRSSTGSRRSSTGSRRSSVDSQQLSTESPDPSTHPVDAAPTNDVDAAPTASPAPSDATSPSSVSPRSPISGTSRAGHARTTPTKGARRGRSPKFGWRKDRGKKPVKWAEVMHTNMFGNEGEALPDAVFRRANLNITRAVVVGVGQYQDFRIPHAPTCVPDAIRVARQLREAGMQVSLLHTDMPDEDQRPLAKNVIQAITQAQAEMWPEAEYKLHQRSITRADANATSLAKNLRLPPILTYVVGRGGHMDVSDRPDKVEEAPFIAAADACASNMPLCGLTVPSLLVHPIMNVLVIDAHPFSPVAGVTRCEGFGLVTSGQHITGGDFEVHYSWGTGGCLSHFWRKGMEGAAVSSTNKISITSLNAWISLRMQDVGLCPSCSASATSPGDMIISVPNTACSPRQGNSASPRSKGSSRALRRSFRRGRRDWFGLGVIAGIEAFAAGEHRGASVRAVTRALNAMCTKGLHPLAKVFCHAHAIVAILFTIRPPKRADEPWFIPTQVFLRDMLSLLAGVPPKTLQYQIMYPHQALVQAGGDFVVSIAVHSESQAQQVVSRWRKLPEAQAKVVQTCGFLVQLTCSGVSQTTDFFDLMSRVGGTLPGEIVIHTVLRFAEGWSDVHKCATRIQQLYRGHVPRRYERERQALIEQFAVEAEQVVALQLDGLREYQQWYFQEQRELLLEEDRVIRDDIAEWELEQRWSLAMRSWAVVEKVHSATMEQYLSRWYVDRRHLEGVWEIEWHQTELRSYILLMSQLQREESQGRAHIIKLSIRAGALLKEEVLHHKSAGFVFHTLPSQVIVAKNKFLQLRNHRRPMFHKPVLPPAPTDPA